MHTWLNIIKNTEVIPSVQESIQNAKAYRGWVALQGGVDMTQTEQLVLLQEACLDPHGIQGRSSMTLWRNKVIYKT